MKQKTLERCLRYLGIDKVGRKLKDDEIVTKAVALVQKTDVEVHAIVKYDEENKNYAVAYDPDIASGKVTEILELYSIEKDIEKKEEKAPVKENGKAGVKPKGDSKGKGGSKKNS